MFFSLQAVSLPQGLERDHFPLPELPSDLFATPGAPGPSRSGGSGAPGSLGAPGSTSGFGGAAGPSGFGGASTSRNKRRSEEPSDQQARKRFHTDLQLSGSADFTTAETFSPSSSSDSFLRDEKYAPDVLSRA